MSRTTLLCLLAGLFALVAFSVFMWGYNYEQGLMTQTLLKETTVQATKQRESEQGSIHQLFVTTQGQRDALSHYFVSQDGVAAVVGDIEKMGTGNGAAAQVSDITVARAATARAWTINLTIEAVGSQSAVGKFLNKMELFPLVLSMEKVSYEKLPFDPTVGERWRL